MRSRVLQFKTAAVAPSPADRRAGIVGIHRIVVPFAVKADTIDKDARTFEGLASVWGPDLGDDVMHKGAFKKTIADWKKGSDALPLLNSHNHWDIMSAVGQLLDAEENDEGLWTKWEIIDGADGDRVLERLRPSARNGRAPVSKMSIGYEPMKFDFEQSDSARWGQLRNLREVALKETSLVLFPMAPGARISVQSVKQFSTDVALLDPNDLDADTRAEFRRLATRIGHALSGKATPPSTEPEPPESTDEPANPPTPAPKPAPVVTDPPASPPTPAAPEATADPRSIDGPVYMFPDALRQRILGLKIASVT